MASEEFQFEIVFKFKDNTLSWTKMHSIIKFENNDYRARSYSWMGRYYAIAQLHF